MPCPPSQPPQLSIEELAMNYVLITQPYVDDHGGWSPPDDDTRYAATRAWRAFFEQAPPDGWLKFLDEARVIHRIIFDK